MRPAVYRAGAVMSADLREALLAAKAYYLECASKLGASTPNDWSEGYMKGQRAAFLFVAADIERMLAEEPES